MNEIALRDVPATSAIVGVNAMFANMTTQVERTVHETAWPVQEAAWPVLEPVYVTSRSASTFSFFHTALAFTSTTGSAEFAQEIATVFASLSEGQEPLGAEFEAAWDANVDALYQS